jgi:hypothetical protein
MSNSNIENLDILENINLSKTKNESNNSIFDDTNIEFNNLFESEIETLNINDILNTNTKNSEITDTTNRSLTDSKNTDITKLNNSTIDLKNIIESENKTFDIYDSPNYLEKVKQVNSEEIIDNNNNIKIPNIKKRNSFLL